MTVRLAAFTTVTVPPVAGSVPQTWLPEKARRASRLPPEPSAARSNVQGTPATERSSCQAQRWPAISDRFCIGEGRPTALGRERPSMDRPMRAVPDHLATWLNTNEAGLDVHATGLPIDRSADRECAVQACGENFRVPIRPPGDLESVAQTISGVAAISMTAVQTTGAD